MWQVLVNDLKWSPVGFPVAVPVSGGHVMIALSTVM